MDKIGPASWRTLVKRLRKLGFEGPYVGGKHPYMIKRNIVLTIPNPHKKEIGVDLLIRDELERIDFETMVMNRFFELKPYLDEYNRMLSLRIKSAV